MPLVAPWIVSSPRSTPWLSRKRARQRSWQGGEDMRNRLTRSTASGICCQLEWSGKEKAKWEEGFKNIHRLQRLRHKDKIAQAFMAGHMDRVVGRDLFGVQLLRRADDAGARNFLRGHPPLFFPGKRKESGMGSQIINGHPENRRSNDHWNLTPSQPGCGCTPCSRVESNVER